MCLNTTTLNNAGTLLILCNMHMYMIYLYRSVSKTSLKEKGIIYARKGKKQNRIDPKQHAQAAARTNVVSSPLVKGECAVTSGFH